MRPSLTPFLAALLFLVTLRAPAAEKLRDWQTGKVLNTDQSSYLAGTVSNSNTHRRAVYRIFVIEGDTHTYVAEQQLNWRWSKPATLTVNGPVKFAVEKRKLFAIDDEGKEYELAIVKRVLKQEQAK